MEMARRYGNHVTSSLGNDESDAQTPVRSFLFPFLFIRREAGLESALWGLLQVPASYFLTTTMASEDAYETCSPDANPGQENKTPIEVSVEIWADIHGMTLVDLSDHKTVFRFAKHSCSCSTQNDHWHID